MELIYAELSSRGPVRSNNEDCVDFWQPKSLEERRERGALAVLADGVGGHGQGEVASQLAASESLHVFRELKPHTSPRQALFQMVSAANLAVYDRGMAAHDAARMATTLTLLLFRNNEVTVAHVGDCRAYLIQKGQLQRLTIDHNYAAQQLKLGLISAADAASSDLRCMLSRSIGRELTVQADYATVQVNPGDYLVQCSDGLHQHVTEGELREIVSRATPADACRELVTLAEKRGTDDNLSIQIVQVKRVEQLMYYRGLPIYHEPEALMSGELEAGHVLDGRFQIVDAINRSGMASIFKAQDLHTGETVAVKVPHLQFESDAAFFSRFQREEEIGRTLDHPYVLRVMALDEQKSRPYIVMEYLEGQTLRHVMQSTERLPAAVAIDIACRICEALDYLHAHNIIHRDLKPENIMLCNDGSLRIMDFGIAKVASLRRLTFAGFSPAMGTPDYMAPEQVKGRRGDARTDIYSLGAILFEMFTGQTPFEGQNAYAIMNARLVSDPTAPRDLNPELSPQLEEIVLHALEQQPHNRYPTAAAMRAELLAPENVEVTGRCDRLRPPAPGQNRWHTVRLVLLGMLVPVVLFGILYLVFRPPWGKH